MEMRANNNTINNNNSNNNTSSGSNSQRHATYEATEASASVKICSLRKTLACRGLKSLCFPLNKLLLITSHPFCLGQNKVLASGLIVIVVAIVIINYHHNHNNHTANNNHNNCHYIYEPLLGVIHL